MASDVEMNELKASSSSTPASSRSSLAVIINHDDREEEDVNSADDDDDDHVIDDHGIDDHGIDDDHDGIISIRNSATSSPSGPISVPVLVHNSISPGILEPPPNPAATPTLKPKSAKPKPRSPSRSPPPPPPPPQLQTIRLKICLGGPSNYEVDIARQARETGQRPPTPTPIPIDIKKIESSESEEEDKTKDGTKPKSKKKKKITHEEYDTSDPFIDDSELAVDQRKWFGQTKQQGFYVSSGEVALVKDKSPKKPKSKKPSLATALNPPTLTEGIRNSPVPTVSDSEVKKELPADEDLEAGDEHAGQKRKRYITVVEGGKKRKIVNIHSFHPDLQVGIESIKQAIAQESWAQKGKFPPALKPQLAQLALLAIKLDEYDDHFFNLMPTLFPYNKFTMTKLIKRTVYTDHVALLVERQEILLNELAELARLGFAKAEEEWERSVVAWDRRQEKLRAEAAEAANGTAAGTGAGTTSSGPTRHPTEEMDVDQQQQTVGGTGAPGTDGDGEGGKEGKDHGQHPPAKRFRMTETMKNIVWNLVLLSNECCRLENEKNTYEGSMIQVSEQGLRKVLYQKIVAAFPEGWMSSGQISRDVSVMKKKYEKENMENET
ncbi:uncharacterized protein LACBIDRAFT_319105 [Laccaria bicolor S238N-H82]|uniref:Predicted protein n=1 Tax=Laccaria bicolor (strain S238N-H82 / ATCC MYA-4686) TaxID=486041 RepID=B0D7W2_LACBS|nr:uncharacterized protein LACBIDRAFT_319105 [Laccaria bicolor S238N-H82]EDR09474.1 predicted protein [Laccaria bicolor S238N-H82]|eukprot:XP_001879823.1 predicted protein [Laccaria bicolor S238N-H82]